MQTMPVNDCCARIKSSMLTVAPMATVGVPLGFCVALPPGWEMQVRPRSGLSRQGIMVSLGTVDAGYRGEVSAVVTNLSGKLFIIHDGDRIAQVSFHHIDDLPMETVAELPVSSDGRGSDGFGSTGV